MPVLTRDTQINIENKTSFSSYPVWVKFIERVTILAGIIGPITVIPQIFEIYLTKNATGVSAFSWLAFALLDIPFLLYGLIHKDKPIVFTYSFWLIANFTVACGALIYS